MNRNLRAFKWFMETFLNNGYEKPVYGSYKLLHECNLRCEFCNVWRTPMKTNSRGRKGKVGSEKISRQEGYLYFIDKGGYVARAKMNRKGRR